MDKPTPIAGRGRKSTAAGNWVLFAVGFAAFVVGCRSLPPLPAVSLAAEGWSMKNGQAVWRLPHARSEIAGDLLLATKSDGQLFVQFSKNPFPLITAQSTAKGWQVEIHPEKRRYSGRGSPSTRLIWVYLAWAASGKTLPETFSWHSNAEGWRLENRNNGESLTGYFNP
jgi:hypothetical protein